MQSGVDVLKEVSFIAVQLTGEVTETIENARNIIDGMPKAKKDLGPLLDALTRSSFPPHPLSSLAF